MEIKEFIKERIESNKGLFKKDELEKIKTNIEIISKIYLLGSIDSANMMQGGAN